jgi:hypothetical protein
MRDLTIVGCGGFGREVADVVAAMNAVTPAFRIVGFADDNPSATDINNASSLGLDILGGVADLLEGPPGSYVLGIGSGAVRERLDQRFREAGWVPEVLVHPSVTIGADVLL